MDEIIISCPHCKQYIYINKLEINCHIFRHGVYIQNFKQIDSHLSKLDCDYLFNNKLIYGCSKPFKLILTNNIYTAEACDYI